VNTYYCYTEEKDLKNQQRNILMRLEMNKMTLNHLLQRVQDLVDQGKGECEVRFAEDLSYGNVNDATIEMEGISVAHIIEKPTEMSGVLAMTVNEAKWLVNDPLSIRDDEVETKEFILIQ
jgi:hypothetical protein